MSAPVPLAPSTWPTWIAVGLLGALRWLPKGVRNALSVAIARLIQRRNTATNRAVNINLQACFPKFDESVRHAIFERYLALHLQAYFLLPRNWWGSVQSIVEKTRLHNQHFLDDAIKSDRPVILLITHSCALDAGLCAMVQTYPMHGIYNPIKNPVLDYLVLKGRTRFGGAPMPRGNGFRQLINGLHDGQIMCYLCDEDYGAQGSVFAPMFARQKATLAMLPRIVAKTNALVVPMITHHSSDDDGIDVHLFEALQNYPSGDAVTDATTMNNAIAETIRLQPAQFTWKLRIFITCPKDKDTRYGQIERGELSVEDL